jgi:hypothetical protein
VAVIGNGGMLANADNSFRGRYSHQADLNMRLNSRGQVIISWSKVSSVLDAAADTAASGNILCARFI